MAYTYGFFDNQMIGVDDLNRISSNFVSGGVARNPSSVDDLNSYASDVVLTGVVPETDTSLSVTVTEGKINISSGTAFFENGTHIKITESETLDFAGDNVTNYVYLVSDFDQMKAFPLASAEELTSTETIFYVLLAIVSPNGTTVTDKRQYARGKLAYYGSADINHNIKTSVDVSVEAEGSSVFNIYCNPSFYEKIIFKSGVFGPGSDSRPAPQFNFAYYDINDGLALSIGLDSSVSSIYSYMGGLILCSGNGNRAGVQRERVGANVELMDDGFKITCTNYWNKAIDFSVVIELVAKGGSKW